MSVKLHLLLWAKTDQAEQLVHPLICHLIDVGVVARGLWADGLQKSARQFIADRLSLDIQQAGVLVAFWAALHDLGKASPVFQGKYRPAAQEQKTRGIPFPRVPAADVPHGIISAWAIEKLLPELIGLPIEVARKIGRVVGGHHGSWPLPGQLLASKLHSGVVGNEVWGGMRIALVNELLIIFSPPTITELPESQEQKNALLTFLSGFVSVADWVGSNKDFFPCMPDISDIEEYTQMSADNAHKALSQLGWGRWHPFENTTTFQELFPSFRPTDLQTASVKAISSTEPPAIAILEAPTGTGKTEVSFYAADLWVQQSQAPGIYVAMPTMATSNQMFDRFSNYLATRNPDDDPRAVLAHSQARFDKERLGVSMTEVPQDGGNRLDALAWFQNNKKQTLLYPFGVGTVDQALISVLQTKHFFVRLFGLAGKTIIFDEVHAYDTYMSAIFFRLLGWLRVMGVSVMVLSATLPHEAREEILSAFFGKKFPLDRAIKYPRITIADRENVTAVALPPPAERPLKIEWLADTTDEITQILAQELKEGGCASVICNTVRHAQETYLHLRAMQIVEEGELMLFHSRYPSVWRRQIEADIVRRFGKDPAQRPKKAIVIATQVVEQSLDLDFDLMLTELAPVDLLLQRAGRLHRHQQHNETRPKGLRQARLIIVKPSVNNNAPDFGASSHVYEDYFLLRTLYALEGKDEIRVISETEQLIEEVYGEVVSIDHPYAELVSNSREAMLERQEKEVRAALNRLIPLPNDENLLSDSSDWLEEDNPEIHKAFQAMTRLIDPGVSLICLHRTSAGILLDPHGRSSIDLDTLPKPGEISSLLERVVTVQDKRVFRHLLEHQSHQLPKKWREVAALRHHRLAVFEEGRLELAGQNFRLHLDQELGLSVIGDK
ncbi:MAG: CRISPR-associated helicase Cas3' [Anaerolineales bacterium]